MTDTAAACLVIALLLNIIGISVSAEFTRDCSPLCECDTWYELPRASCTGRHLYNVDTGAPSNVQALDLSDNVVSSLNNFELANIGLTNLRYLNLSGNTISDIDLGAFHGLADLTVLDLSKNHLYSIPDDIFVNNKHLQILKLSRNHFNSHVPKLRSSSITEISLDSCQISHLPPDTFNGLTRLRRLDLSNNLMIQMSSAVLQTLHFLKKISVEGNPWLCNRVVQDLHTYLVHKNIEFSVICGKKYPKKFEKIVIAPAIKKPTYHQSIIANATVVVTQKTEPEVTKPLDDREKSIYKTVAKETNIISLYWFLVIGFILGIATGMVSSYIWLSGKYTQCWRRDNFLNDTQRHSLLFSPYLLNSVDSNASLTESCPGTPPPSYRDVMLRPSTYRCLSRTSNLNPV
ncbi:uncharacterized protein LOC116432244 [Nomia melanderi]|uniref:uncharacterized protein LOC116432244 n=1 Tax=Nomia melanderi TaxID=2448451 RepID=UPI001304792F|nr:leucine-rich repeat-containing G-protein coupled receptor 5-like [Nomia melanderi]